MKDSKLKKALARPPGRDFAEGLSAAGLGRPDLELATRQHRRYLEALGEAGLEVEVLEPLEGYPDAWFVEDAAVALPEGAVLARPGAPSRRGEAAAMAAELGDLPLIGRIEAPGTLDGGDVLPAGGRVFIGLSARTNAAGARQLSALLAPLGYHCSTVQVGQGLHLKSGVNWIGPGTLLATPRFARLPCFDAYRRVVVGEDESYAANALRVNDRLLLASGFPKIRRRLESQGFDVVRLDVSEARKMDGGLTCLSLRF